MRSLRLTFHSSKLAACASPARRRAARSAPNATITSALRALGLAADSRYSNYHRLVNRAAWSARQGAGVLLGLLVRAFACDGPLVIGLDDTIERRRGSKIKARAIYRDAARPSHSCFQKTSGLRWLSLHLLVPVGWARRVWALPFLTALCPSERYPLYAAKGRRHKSLLERARGVVGQARRWLPGRVLILVAGSGFAAIELLAWCQRLAQPVTMITRLRLDAALFAPAPARAPGARGRPPLKGARLPTLAQRLTQSTTRWKKARLNWHGGIRRWVEVATDTAVWYHSGLAPVGLRWVLLARSAGKVRLAGSAVHRSEPVSQRDRERLRASLADGDHLPGDQGAPRLRGAAPMEGSRHRALDPAAPGALLPGHPHRAGSTRLASQRAAGGVVPKGAAHLQ